jgi:hypothetical protein
MRLVEASTGRGGGGGSGRAGTKERSQSVARVEPRELEEEGRAVLSSVF